MGSTRRPRDRGKRPCARKRDGLTQRPGQQIVGLHRTALGPRAAPDPEGVGLQPLGAPDHAPAPGRAGRPARSFKRCQDLVSEHMFEPKILWLRSGRADRGTKEGSGAPHFRNPKRNQSPCTIIRRQPSEWTPSSSPPPGHRPRGRQPGCRPRVTLDSKTDGRCRRRLPPSLRRRAAAAITHPRGARRRTP